MLSQFSPDNNKLFFRQDWCHEITDKYIEYEPVAILIDLILLTRSAYRHVLFNSKFKVNNITRKKIDIGINQDIF